MGIQNRVQKTENNMYGWITKCVVLRGSVGITGGKDYRQLRSAQKSFAKNLHLGPWRVVFRVFAAAQPIAPKLNGLKLLSPYHGSGG